MIAKYLLSYPACRNIYPIKCRISVHSLFYYPLLSDMTHYHSDMAQVHPWWFIPLYAIHGSVRFLGTVTLAVGQCFGLNLFPVMSNLGFLFYILAIVFLMKEVDKDMAATAEFAEC
ncbi:MAG: hypothetical protein ACREBR_03805 [bacterium]